MNPKISIIVPVFNVQEYLNKCIDSILEQTYKNFELILVDDGSTDNSSNICEEYKKNYDNIIVLHQANQGQSAARNNGVNISKADFIMFVDSDDYIAPDCVEMLYESLLRTDCDIAIGKHCSVWDDNGCMKRNGMSMDYEVLFPGKSIIDACYGKKFGLYAWGKLYKKRLVIKNPFPEGVLFEDVETVYKILGDSNKIIWVNRYIYFYRERKGSTVRGEITEKHFNGIRASEKLINYSKKYYPEAIEAAKIRYVIETCTCIGRTLEQHTAANRKIFYALRKKMKKYSKLFLVNKHVTLSRKIKSVSVFGGYGVAWCTYKIFKHVEKVKSGIKMQIPN